MNLSFLLFMSMSGWLTSAKYCPARATSVVFRVIIVLRSSVQHHYIDFNVTVSVPVQTGDTEAATCSSLLSLGGNGGGGSSSTGAVDVINNNEGSDADGARRPAIGSGARRSEVCFLFFLRSVLFMIDYMSSGSGNIPVSKDCFFGWLVYS